MAEDEKKEEALDTLRRAIPLQHDTQHLIGKLQDGRKEAQQERLRQGLLPKHMTSDDPDNTIHEDLEDDETYDEDMIYDMFSDDEEDDYESLCNEDKEAQDGSHGGYY